MSKQKLLPCPFCGASAALLLGEARCTNNPTCVEGVAVESWNRRATMLATQGQVVAVRIHGPAATCAWQDAKEKDLDSGRTMLDDIRKMYAELPADQREACWLEYAYAAAQPVAQAAVPEGYAIVELNSVPDAAASKGVEVLRLARQMGYSDETTAMMIFVDMLPLAAASTPEEPC